MLFFLPSFVVLMQIYSLRSRTCHTASMEKWTLQLRLLSEVEHFSCSCFLRSSVLRTVYIYKNNLLLPSNVIHSFLLLTVLLFLWRQHTILIPAHFTFEAKIQRPNKHGWSFKQSLFKITVAENSEDPNIIGQGISSSSTFRQKCFLCWRSENSSSIEGMTLTLKVIQWALVTWIKMN